jgi:NAD(P)-dependent dehydrogenase (short-subunit alcohol dehydrogenase family)
MHRADPQAPVPPHSPAARRVALVTGGNRGLGLETCRQLVERGLDVVLTSRDETSGRAAAKSVGARWQGLDVSDERSVARAAKEVGPVDVLVNNAAILLDEDKPILDIDDAAVRATVETNVLGAWRTCRAFVPGMRESGYGRVVNVSSGAGSLGEPETYAPVYSVSKAALNLFTRILALECEGTNVKVNAVCPGWVRTDMGGASAPRSVRQGASGIVWAATLPDDGPTNGFFRDGQPAEW